jgi:LysR family hydrogen peroxide-inducible transcriptional activator
MVAVADRRSFRRAAADCHVSQPSLSSQIAAAEVALGVRFFERDRRRVLLTQAGATLVDQARRVLRDADELVDSATRLGDPLSGTLRLGVIPTIGPYLLPDLAPALQGEYPRLKQVWVEDKTHNLVSALMQGDLDAAVLALEAELGDVVYEVLGKDPFVFAAAPTHPLSKAKGPIRAEELDGHHVLLLDDGHCFRDQALSFCAGAGAQELALRATSLPTLTQMVAAGSGVTVLPRMAIDVENRRNALRIRPFRGKPPERTIVLAWRRNSALEPTLRPVAETLREAFRALPKSA